MAISGRSLNRNTQHFTVTGDQLGLLLDPTGGLSATAAGLAVTNDLQDGRGTLDPAGGGGTIALPTAAGALINPGVAFDFGDYFLVTSAGTIGTGIVVGAGDVPGSILMFNGTGDGTADAHWTLIRGGAIASYTGSNGVQLVGADFQAQADATTGGDVAPVNIAAAGLGVNVTLLDGDHLTISWTATNYTPDASIAEAADAADLAAHLKGIDDALADKPYRYEPVVLTAAQVSARSVTIPNEAVVTIGDCYAVAFGGAHHHHDGTNVIFAAGAAGAGTVSWAAGTPGDGSLGGELVAGDVLHLFVK